MTKSSVSLSDKCVWCWAIYLYWTLSKTCMGHSCDTAMYLSFYHFLKEERKKVGFLTKLLLVLAHLSLDLVAVVL